MTYFRNIGEHLTTPLSFFMKSYDWVIGLIGLTVEDVTVSFILLAKENIFTELSLRHSRILSSIFIILLISINRTLPYS